MNKPILASGEERRTYKVELRTDDMEGMPVMRGHAAVVNSWSEDLGGFREMIAPGAFASVLKDDVRSLINHDPNLVMGRTKSGTLRMVEDDNGLSIENDAPDTSYSRDLQISMKRGDIDQMSFSFSIPDGGDSWRKAADGVWERTISTFKRLYDVSFVTYPAYGDTTCAMRSLEKIQNVRVATPAKQKEGRSSMKKNTDTYRRKFDAFEGKESRVDLGYSGENSAGMCCMCNQDGCCCPGCPNEPCCNMQMAADGGCCTKCMKPGCCCLTCPNTDQCKLMKMYSM